MNGLSSERLQRLTDLAAAKRRLHQRHYQQAVAALRSAQKLLMEAERTLARIREQRLAALRNGIASDALAEVFRFEKHWQEAVDEAVAQVERAREAEAKAQQQLLDAYRSESAMQRLTERMRRREMLVRAQRETQARQDLITQHFLRNALERR